MRSQTATALVGLLVSLVVSIAAWVYFDTLLVFLILPFVPILFRGRGGDEQGREARGGATSAEPPVRECPRCGFRTRSEEFSYCPRDGTRLEER
jgi:hypothetical protein